MAPPSATLSSSNATRIDNEGPRRRSLSGASALLARTFTRQSTTATAPRPTASRSESSTTARRRATIAATTPTQQELDDIKVHVRIVPNIENPGRSLIFDIVDRELEVGSIIRIGRYSERHANLNCMSFRSKVVSRCHCEVYVETDGKLYIRDTKSSSGTFLNHVRLSAAGTESRPVELSDGDIVQLGVDFQGGREEMYRSVKMRFELNRSSRPRPLSFSLNAFQNLRNLTQQQQQQQQQQRNNNAILETSSDNAMNEEEAEERTENVLIPTPSLSKEQSNINTNVQQSPTTTTTTTTDNTTTKTNNNNIITLCNTKITTTTTNTSSSPHASCNDNDIDECVICLYALAPFQALFVSPCSHTYHFKCIRPLLQSYPGFQCPICRTYSDLEASVAIEADEVMEKYSYNNRTTIIADIEANVPLTEDSGLGLQSSPSSDIILHHNHDEQGQPSLTLATTRTRTVENNNNLISTSTAMDDEEEQNIPPHPSTEDPYSTTFTASPVNYSDTSPDLLPLDNNLNDTPTATDTDNSHVIEESNLTNDSIEDNAVMSNTEEEDNDEDDDEEEDDEARGGEQAASRPRERRTTHIMDKIKMVFFEKRKSISITGSGNHTNKNQRRNNSQKTPRRRPLSYPNILNNDNAVVEASSSTNTPLRQTLSRQSTTHLEEINEEYIIPPQSGSSRQPMIIDLQ